MFPLELNVLCVEKWQQQGWKNHLASKSHVPVSAGYIQVWVQCLSEINLLQNLLERLDLCSSQTGFHSLSQKGSFFAEAVLIENLQPFLSNTTQ